MTLTLFFNLFGMWGLKGIECGFRNTLVLISWKSDDFEGSYDQKLFLTF